jgi:hypothetical protein
MCSWELISDVLLVNFGDILVLHGPRDNAVTKIRIFSFGIEGAKERASPKEEAPRDRRALEVKSQLSAFLLCCSSSLFPFSIRHPPAPR